MLKKVLPDKAIVQVTNISVDCVIFGFENEKMKVLLNKHSVGHAKGKWALPGGFIYSHESLEDAAYRLLEHLTGVKDLYLEQLGAFSEVDRHPLRRIITVAFYSFIKPGSFNIRIGEGVDSIHWYDIKDVPPLPYDHNHILDNAFTKLKKKIRRTPIGFDLLPPKFTLFQLQQLYEAILEETLDKPNFRRKIMKMELLEALPERQKGVSHRAARLYRFNLDKYNELVETGFTFSI